jgi:hypothetical protein
VDSIAHVHLRDFVLPVKTLVIRSTAEENMMARRDALKGKDGKLPKLMEDVGMRHYIEVSLFAVWPREASVSLKSLHLSQNPTFIKFQPILLSTLDTPLIHGASTDETKRAHELTEVVKVVSDKPNTGSYKRISFVENLNESPKKKKRTTIRFLD